MKKENYCTPQIEVLEIVIEDAILLMSGDNQEGSTINGLQSDPFEWGE